MSTAVIPHTECGLTLNDLARRIRKRHEAAATAMRDAVLHAIETGVLLLEAKKKVGHGEWLSWLEANCDISERTCQAYMRLARMPPEKSAAVADLPLREALSAIKSREQKLADEVEREEERKQRNYYAGVVYTSPTGETFYGKEAIGRIPPGSPLPPPPPATEDEIADNLVRQLAEARREVPEVGDDAWHRAFERRFGKPLIEATPIAPDEPDASAEERKALYAQSEEPAPKTFAEWKSAIVQQIAAAWNALSAEEWATLKRVLTGTMKNLDAAVKNRDAA